MLITLHLIIYLEDFALRGRWSIATVVKQALACRRRLEQKTMKPTMPRVGFALGPYQVQREPLRRASYTGIRNGSKCFEKDVKTTVHRSLA
jgi:hypothetical protein